MELFKRCRVSHETNGIKKSEEPDADLKDFSFSITYCTHRLNLQQELIFRTQVMNLLQKNNVRNHHDRHISKNHGRIHNHIYKKQCTLVHHVSHSTIYLLPIHSRLWILFPFLAFLPLHPFHHLMSLFPQYLNLFHPQKVYRMFIIHFYKKKLFVFYKTFFFFLYFSSIAFVFQ